MPPLPLQFLRRLAPPGEPYLHNDLQYREAPANWPGGWEAWWVRSYCVARDLALACCGEMQARACPPVWRPYFPPLSLALPAGRLRSRRMLTPIF